jgi:hypothetical protein
VRFVLEKLKPVRKAAVAALGLAAQVAALGLLPEAWKPWAAVIVAAATAAGVYQVPNRAPTKTP